VKERIIAVVPIRSLRNGKTRLAPILAPGERAALLRDSAERVIATALNSGEIERILVVTGDDEALAWAGNLGDGVTALAQSPLYPGLNGAIDQAKAWTITDGGDALLSLFGDLPLLTTDDIERVVNQSATVVLGPDRRGEGTNALLLRLAGNGAEFRFAFGDASLGRHLDEARRLGLEIAIVDTLGVGFDLDTPDDWRDFLETCGRPDCSAVWDAYPVPYGVCVG
jgi:2-phospho-L-lactate guanylyltransferase